MSLMPTKKTWTSPEGVQVEYITYRTILVDRIRAALGFKGGDLTDEQSAFILCAATTTDVILPSENVPRWAQMLHDMVKSGTWLKDPLKEYESLGHAPSELINHWWEGYKETRDHSHDAPAELQSKAPLKPEGDDEDEGEESSNPTGGGVPSSNVLSLIPSGKKSVARKKKAT